MGKIDHIDRVWDIIEKVGVCMLTTQFVGQRNGVRFLNKMLRSTLGNRLPISPAMARFQQLELIDR
jgi:hypothetical protein